MSAPFNHNTPILAQIEHLHVTTSYKMQKILPIVQKRLFDVFIASFVIIFILSWLLPVLAILIKMNSRGPVFFIQKRVGANGKIFNCLKLRSMFVNAQANFQQAQANDPRVTPFGKFLRQSCFDELPQFINVLKGDMSIVGPRPHMIKDCEDFSKLIPNYEYRHSVKPGITGIAQIKGYRGTTHCFYDVWHRYRWDAFYVKNVSFFLDLKIIYQTSLQIIVPILFRLVKDKAVDAAALKPIITAKKQLKEVKHFHEQFVEAS